MLFYYLVLDSHTRQGWYVFPFLFVMVGVPVPLVDAAVASAAARIQQQPGFEPMEQDEAQWIAGIVTALDKRYACTV